MFEQRDILLVPVPFTDLTSAKQRPVLVLSCNDYNARSQDILVAAITSNVQPGVPGPLISSNDLEQGSLPLASRIRADKVYALSQSLVRKRYGRVTEKSYREFLAALDEVLGRNAVD